MASTFTIAKASDRFPVGTTVSVYREGQILHGELSAPRGAAALATAIVAAGGSLTFTGLPEGERLIAYALVSGGHRIIRFRTTQGPF
jgi:hypothetical protein